MRLSDFKSVSLPAALGAALLVSMAAAPANATQFVVNNLVSDGSVPAVTIDPDLVNPWGIASSPTGPFWLSDNHTGLSTLYNTGGTKLGLTVAVAPPLGGAPPAAPTGIVFNGSSSFKVTGAKGSGAAAFIYDTEDGTISGWSAGIDLTHSLLAVDNSGSGAVYKGLAIGTDVGPSIYATNFNSGQVEEYDGSFNLVRTFTDGGVDPGYAPFNVQTIGGHLFVTFALQDALKHDDVGGAGNGYVDEFNMDGSFVKRLVSLGGQINSPWGLALAPTAFGTFAGDLLVGNFGDGTISAFDIATGAFKGKLDGTDGNPLVLGDLWALANGNGGMGGSADKVYFTAGIQDEAQGLFGSITGVPEPGTWAMSALGVGLIGAVLRRRRTPAAAGQAA